MVGEGILLETPEDQRLAAEEYIAHLAEKEVKPSWWKELLQRIRMAFSRLPHFKEVRMTDDQINILLARASRKMRRGMFDRKSVVLADGNTQLTDGELRYSIIGEEGAANLDRELKQQNLDNLATAKEMTAVKYSVDNTRKILSIQQI